MCFKWLFVKKEEKVTPHLIWKEYKNLQTTPSGNMYQEQYLRLQKICRENQDVLYDLVFSGHCTEKEMQELIWFGMDHPGSCRRRDNLNWVGFVARVRERKNELPYGIRNSLDWYEKTHGW